MHYTVVGSGENTARKVLSYVTPVMKMVRSELHQAESSRGGTNVSHQGAETHVLIKMKKKKKEKRKTKQKKAKKSTIKKKV